eukprot:1146107-Pelagomonas_calceolata.AAC.2
MRKVQRTNARYLLRNREGRGGDRKISVPAEATPHASKVCCPGQLLPEQRHIHLVEVKYCELHLKTPGPRISWRPPNSSTASSVATS